MAAEKLVTGKARVGTVLGNVFCIALVVIFNVSCIVLVVLCNVSCIALVVLCNVSCITLVVLCNVSCIALVEGFQRTDSTVPVAFFLHDLIAI